MVVPVGETGKFAPLALVPSETPPLGTVYQLILFPAEIAFRFVELPHVTGLGVAVTGLGAARESVTVTGVRISETQEPEKASA